MVQEHNQFGGYQNPAFSGSFMPGGTGFQYAGMAPQAVARRKNVLSQEEIQRLMKKENIFSLAMTEEEQLRATCNHVRVDGNDSLIENADGTWTCEICGYTFKPLSAFQTPPEAIVEAVADILDILQTIKLIYVDMPEEVAKEYFMMIPLLEKLPQFFDIASKNYAKHEKFHPYAFNNRNMGALQMFQMLSGAMQNGMAYQQAPGQAAPGADPNMATNGFGAYGYTGYAPQTQNFAYNPQFGGFGAPFQPQTMVTPPPADAAQIPAAAEGETKTVTEEFKA